MILIETLSTTSIFKRSLKMSIFHKH